MVYNVEELIKKAYEAQSYAYTPYSNFKVGSALLTKNGKIYLGCNIESASYTPTSCAERTAFFKAISEGEKEFLAIAVVGNLFNEDKQNYDYCAPCGVCRQVMAEFCNLKDFEIILAKSEHDFKKYSLEQMLPFSFTKNNLEN